MGRRSPRYVTWSSIIDVGRRLSGKRAILPGNEKPFFAPYLYRRYAEQKEYEMQVEQAQMALKQS
jgi:hypothetical protein